MPVSPDDPRREWPSGDWPPDTRPVPDPTELTDKAISQAVSFIQQNIEAKYDILCVRIDGLEHISARNLKLIEEMPERMDEKVTGHIGIATEQFANLDQQIQNVRDSTAIALSAQKELYDQQEKANDKAITKAETATAETIATNQQLGASRLDALAMTVEDLKGTVTRIEAAKLGAKEDRSGLYAGVAALAGVGSIILFVIAIAAVLAGSNSV